MQATINTLPFRTLVDAPSLRGTRVVVRASLNVPIADGTVRDPFRIDRVLETLQYLSQQGARTVVLGHIGRAPEETLAPVYAYLQTKCAVQWIDAVVGDEVMAAVKKLADGDILLCENVRSDSREVENDPSFGKILASYGEVYINEAFADSHREHASIVGIPQHLPAYAGFQFVREYKALGAARTPAHPALFILGGAKVETKLPLLESLLDQYDHICLGGVLANDVLKAKGVSVGASRVSNVDLSASPLLESAKLWLPSDVVVDGPQGRRAVSVHEVAPEEAILDIGPESVASLASLVSGAQFILWNGPLGNYEAGYGDATNTLAQMVAGAQATSVLGGGDTIAAIQQCACDERVTFISTAGGAMLAFLEQGTLPGIEALS